jgi:hypothetical protein
MSIWYVHVPLVNCRVYWVYLVDLVGIYSHFGMLYQEKSDNPDWRTSQKRVIVVDRWNKNWPVTFVHKHQGDRMRSWKNRPKFSPTRILSKLWNNFTVTTVAILFGLHTFLKTTKQSKQSPNRRKFAQSGHPYKHMPCFGDSGGLLCTYVGSVLWTMKKFLQTHPPVTMYVHMYVPTYICRAIRFFRTLFVQHDSSLNWVLYIFTTELLLWITINNYENILCRAIIFFTLFHNMFQAWTGSFRYRCSFTT